MGSTVNGVRIYVPLTYLDKRWKHSQFPRLCAVCPVCKSTLSYDWRDLRKVENLYPGLGVVTSFVLDCPTCKSLLYLSL